MEQLLTFAESVFEKTRLRMLQVLLLQQELCVCELAEIFKISSARTSQHLQILRRAGVVNERREGKWVLYSLNPETVAAFTQGWQNFLKASPDQDQDLRAVAERLNSEELKALRQCCNGPGRQPKR